MFYLALVQSPFMSPNPQPSRAPMVSAPSRPVTRPPRAVRALCVINYMIRAKLGLAARLETVDRSVLEDIILPAYASRSDVQRVAVRRLRAFHLAL